MLKGLLVSTSLGITKDTSSIESSNMENVEIHFTYNLIVD